MLWWPKHRWVCHSVEGEDWCKTTWSELETRGRWRKDESRHPGDKDTRASLPWHYSWGTQEWAELWSSLAVSATLSTSRDHTWSSSSAGAGELSPAPCRLKFKDVRKLTEAGIGLAVRILCRTAMANIRGLPFHTILGGNSSFWLGEACWVPAKQVWDHSAL